MVSIIKIFEENPKASLFVSLLIAIAIFYISSLTFPLGLEKGFDLKPTIYHIFIFFFLTVFLLFALVRGKKKDFIFITILIALMYGLSDEFHQLFVLGRVASFSDLILDFFGILAASFIYVILIRKRNKKKKVLL